MGKGESKNQNLGLVPLSETCVTRAAHRCSLLFLSVLLLIKFRRSCQKKLKRFFQAGHCRLCDVARLGGDDFIDKTVVHRLLGGHEKVAVAVILIYVHELRQTQGKVNNAELMRYESMCWKFCVKTTQQLVKRSRA